MALISHEGIVLSRYKDSVGVWTIGVGHTKAAGNPDP
ncbi:glycoside hydrolase family protein, partial [Bradyrhizobium sp.]